MPLEYLAGPTGPKQYIELTPLDRGGMGEVFTATDATSKVKVAVKIINLPSADYAALLSRELEIAKTLSGTNIAETLYTGTDRFGAQEFLYLVQRFYSRGNMRKVIQKSMPLTSCLKAMNDLTEGLRIAHKTIVHRDLKPENVLVDDAGNLVLSDFGLSKYVEDSTRSQTFKGSGTYPYMSPECWTNQANTPAMDIYSLGIIFYEVLTGELPGKCSSSDEWRDFHLFGALPEVDKVRSDVPVKLKQVLLKMTQKRTSDRFGSIDEVKTALALAEAQAKAEESEIDQLAQMAHTTIAKKNSDNLKRKADEEREAGYQKLLNFHAEELFSRIDRIAEAVNEKLETDKIRSSRTNFNGNIQSKKMEFSFGGKTLYVTFSRSSLFEDYYKQEISRQRGQPFGTQRRAYFGSSGGFFKQKNIIQLGELECNHQNPALNACFGFNLLLVKSDAEQYGKWYLASFSDSGFSANPVRREFSLQEHDFLQHFELCFSMHTMKVEFREIQDSDFSRAVQEILRN